MRWKEGDRVRIKQNHWLRPDDVGTIEKIDGRKQSAKWLIRFDTKRKDGGLQGRHLWMEEEFLTKLEE